MTASATCPVQDPLNPVEVMVRCRSMQSRARQSASGLTSIAIFVTFLMSNAKHIEEINGGFVNTIVSRGI